MSFGKRGAGGDGTRRPPPPPQNPVSQDGREALPGAPKMQVANAGSGFDFRFMALAVGVVAIAAGGAMAAPSLLSMFSSKPVRPIEVVVAGLDRDQAKAALAAEALPDKEGAAFMTALHKHYPDSHDRLLGQMADAAIRGGDRDSMSREVNEWLVEFAPQNVAALGRTGSKGFDFALQQTSDVMRLWKQELGSCTPKSVQRFVADPTDLVKKTAYGSKIYEFNVRFSKEFVELAAAGKDAPAIDAKLTPQDETALQSVVVSLISDRKVMNLVQTGMIQARGGSANYDEFENLDLCALGQTLIDKLDQLPDGTKARLWAMGATEFSKMMKGGRSAMMPPRPAI
jgi:hypothetical protein